MEPPNREERMLCPCMRCKHQIIRKRRICNEHVRECGMFPMERLQNLRFQSYGSQNEQPTLDDITPVATRPQQRTRISDNVGTTSRDESHSGMEEEGMEEMLDAFYELDPMVQQEGGVGEHQGVDVIPRYSQQEFGQEEDEMRKLARLPLYNGAKISVLRASLAMLNLQSIFGWSDVSVSELFM